MGNGSYYIEYIFKNKLEGRGYYWNSSSTFWSEEFSKNKYYLNLDEIERPLDSVEKPLNNNGICSEFEYD